MTGGVCNPMNPTATVQPRMIYVIGYPGSGKTTVMSKAVEGWSFSLEDHPFKHTVYENDVIQLGYARDVYGGTDGLSFNVQPKVAEWLVACDSPVVLAEGDRLANGKFFDTVQKTGWDLQVIHLKVPELLAYRRAWERGSEFDGKWMRGRVTKVDNLVAYWKESIITLDGNKTVEELAKYVKDEIRMEDGYAG